MADTRKKRTNEKININNLNEKININNLIKARRFIEMAKVGSKMHEKPSG
jgi:hypothetical protein